MTTEIPTIETNRLRLRAHSQQDLAACAAMWGDPVVTKFIGGKPFTREEVWARMLRYAGHWAWLGYGFWIVEERDSGQFVGEVGLADFKRDLDPPLICGPEAGWALAASAHGRGFATEALTAVTEWHQMRVPPQTISCVIHPDNAASIKVAIKCGFRAGQRALYKGQPTTGYLRPSRTAV
jgi:RimJ/RimL family protein N-acetyltransferase